MQHILHFKYLLLILIYLPFHVNAQNKDSLVVMFYNVENYFDTINNPMIQDDFTPDDIYEWTYERFIKKRNALAEVISKINGQNVPDIIGLCEVENRFVLSHLADSTKLKSFNYSILHKDSPDARGIDVALLYRKNYFKLIDSAYFLMSDTLNLNKREILYAKGLVNKKDTLHLMVVHFPSKRSGVIKTEPLRYSAAKALRKVTDSILLNNPKSNILIMGDFNDTYKSKSIQRILKAVDNSTVIQDTNLYNLSAVLAKQGVGSIKHRDRWQMVDMFLASGYLLDTLSSLYTKVENVQVFKPDFLLEYVEAKNTYRPKPTYRWINYVGGYSDHLPILLKIHCK